MSKMLTRSDPQGKRNIPDEFKGRELTANYVSVGKALHVCSKDSKSIQAYTLPPPLQNDHHSRKVALKYFPSGRKCVMLIRSSVSLRKETKARGACGKSFTFF